MPLYGSNKIDGFKKVAIRGNKIHNLKNPALINYKDKEVFMTGESGMTFHYSIRLDRWSEGPCAIQSRSKHSGCSLGDYIYVSCGYDPD